MESVVPIWFSTPQDVPYGCFHPASRYHGFREDGVYWSTVAQYCLAQELVSAADRERVRTQARDPDHAIELARELPRVPDAAARALAALPRALQLSFETNLGVRAILVATGDQPIEARLGDDAVLGVGLDGRGANHLGRALEEVRALVRVRALDPDAVQCIHQEPERTRRACEHVLSSRASPRRFHRRFTGVGAEYVLVCEPCAADPSTLPPLRTVCGDCFADLLCGHRLADIGEPVFPHRASDLGFAHRELRLDGLAADEVRALVPVADRPATWMAIAGEGALWRLDLDLDGGRAERVAVLDPSAIDVGGPHVLAVAASGELVAVAEARGRRAVVLEAAGGRELLRLERDAYHPEHCRFPLGFFELDGRLLLVHATEWNRLDVCDPRTGARLTERPSPTYARGEPQPPHYLDYFHAGLVISPDGRRVVDNGWVWHPYGVVRVFDLHRWVTTNPWESEDGPSVHTLCGRSYYWDGPVAWLDERRVAVWGDGDDETELTPAALIFDADTGEELSRFHGPPEGFAAVAGQLIAFDRRGTSVWDPTTGERLHHDGSFSAHAAHPRSGELVSTSGAAFRVSRLAEKR